MQFKEQRSISFAQSDKEKVYNLQLRSSKPSFSQASTNDLHQGAKSDQSQRQSIKVAPVDPKRSIKQKFLLNKQKSFDSQGFEEGKKQITLSSYGGESADNLQDIKYAVVISTSSCEQTMVQDDNTAIANWTNNFQKGCETQRSGQGLKSQGSATSLGISKMRNGSEGLKNLQNARMDRQLGRKRSETTTNNESYGFIHLKTKENRHNDMHQMKLSSNPFKLQDPHLTTEKTKKETMQSLLTLSALNNSTEKSQEENDFLKARKNANILIEDKDYKNLDDVVLQPYELRQRDDLNDLQRRSEDLPDEAVSEQSCLDIPNEHLTKPGSQLKKYLKPEIQKPIASIQRNRSSQDIQIDLSLVNKQISEGREFHKNEIGGKERFAKNNINTVRDSSPLKSMGQFANIKESNNNQKGSMSERQNLLLQNDTSSKMFTQRIQFLNTMKSQNEGSYKQPKQGQKRQNQRKQDAQTQNQRAATQLLNFQESPRQYYSKESSRVQMLPYQSNPSIQKTNERIQSDFVNSLEEEDIDFNNKSTQLVGVALEQNSFNIGQSFHLPSSLALNKTHNLQNFIQGKQTSINNLNIRAGPQENSQATALNVLALTERQSLSTNPQPQTGNLDDLKRSQSKIDQSGMIGNP